MTIPTQQPGEQRPLLDRAPSERYGPPPDETPAGRSGADAVLVPVAIILGGAIAFVLLGGIVLVTSGLIVAAGFLGWLTGRLVSPPRLAAAVALAAVVVGLLAIWLYGRTEGGVLDPIAYLNEVEGPFVVVASLLAGGGLAAAASR